VHSRAAADERDTGRSDDAADHDRRPASRRLAVIASGPLASDLLAV